MSLWTCGSGTDGRWPGSPPATANYWTDDINVVAFSKGNRGGVAFRNSTEDKQVRVQTGLPKGSYCDTVHGGGAGGVCAGPSITVDTTGFAPVTVKAKDSPAITRADRVSNRTS